MQRIIWCACLYVLVTNAFAHGDWFVNGGAGVTFPRTSDTNYISSGPGWPNDRYSNDGVDSAALLAVSAGYQWMRKDNWLPFYSLAGNYIYAFPAKVKGTVDQYSLPQFENYNYQYKVQTQSFLAVAKA